MSTSDIPKVTLRIEPLSPLTEFRVSDARFRDVKLPSNVGQIETLLPQGVYQVSFREGVGWQNQLVLLSPDAPEPAIVKQPAPPAMQLMAEPLDDESTELPLLPNFSRVTLRARIINAPEDSSSPNFAPLGEAELIGVDSENSASEALDGQLKHRRFDVSPGYWLLRYGHGGKERKIEMPLVVCPHWHTIVTMAFDLRYGPSRARWDPSELQVRLAASDATSSDPTLRKYERAALQSLSGRRSLHGAAFTSLIRGLIGDKRLNPMLGLYGAHLLPCKSEEDHQLLEEVIGNLERLVCGPDAPFPLPNFAHPDVEALKLRLLLQHQAPLDELTPFEMPPMLNAGWRCLLEAAQQRPGLIPRGSVTEQVAARLYPAGPWLAWSRSHRDALRVQSRSAGTPPSVRQVHPQVILDSSDITTLGSDTRIAAEVGIVAREHTGIEFRAATPTQSPEEFESSCRLIRAGVAHRKLREWYRNSIADTDEQADQPLHAISLEERLVVAALYPVASDEERQRLLDASIIATARSTAALPSAADLGRQLGLPNAAVAAAAVNIAQEFLARAQLERIPLEMRSAMAVPELILPYDPEFLGDGFKVPAPVLSDQLRQQAYADATLIDYTHFSLVMHMERRVAIFAANNIDAARKVRVSGGLNWRMDERVGEFQLGPEVYANNQLDRGHMVRREDVLWGTVSEARLANKATYFYANAAPQHQNFNQDEWVTLEDWVLDRATEFSYRLCVFTGPVLRDNDPVLTDLPPGLRTAFTAQGPAQIPAAFWKVIVLRDASAAGEDLSVVAFAMRQSDMWNDREGRQLLSLKVHQVTLSAIEAWTSLDFGELKQADELEWSEERARLRNAGQQPEWPQIRSLEDIVFSGSSRRARGLRARRAPGTRSTPSIERVRERCTTCGDGKGETFDARAAIAALNHDVERLTALLAGQTTSTASTTPQDPAAATPGMPTSRSARRTDDTSDSTVEDPRVTEMVDATPTTIREEMRVFARAVTEQGDIARGTRRPAEPQEMLRIIGGEDVPPGSFLSCVCIGDAAGWFCTGVLVAPRVVLTAAHCGQSVSRVMVGGNSVRQLDSSARIVPVQSVHVHTGYRASPHDENDINLLVLSEPANVPPAPIANLEQLRAATAIQLVGFGYNDPQRPLGFGTKRQVSVPMAPIINLSTDQDLSALEAQLGFHAMYEFVAGRKGLGRDTCNGDSGGPAYVALPQFFAVAGLTSRATKVRTANCGDGGIYVRPDRFLEWVNTTITLVGLPSLPT